MRPLQVKMHVHFGCKTHTAKNLHRPPGGIQRRIRGDHFGIGCDLELVKLTGWKRKMWGDAIYPDWICPSPNIPNFISTLLFPGTVHFEGTQVSEGRGTTRPFEFIGAPFISPDDLASKMNKKKLKGKIAAG